MSKTYLMIFAALVSTSLVAQTVTNAPASPPIEAPAVTSAVTNPPATNTPTTNAPTAKKAAKKKSEKKAVAKKKAPAAPLVTTPLNPGPAVCEANNVNVRGQAKLKSEVVGKLTKGQQVTVLEEVQLKNSGPEEPSAWAKILLPTNTLVWINTSFIDPANKTVKPKKLNIRSGPGENYSVIGTLKQGDAVKDISTKGDWTQIEPPADAFAFVAAQFLKQGEAAPVVASSTLATTTPTPEPAPPTTTNTVTEPTIASTTEPVPVPTTPPSTTPPPSTNEPPVTTEPSATTTNTPPEETEPPPKRIVQREGIVRGTFSIQAPTKYELISPDNRRTINYLSSDSPDLDLSRYKGLRIIITGEEGLDERWRNTPVITIQKIQVLDYGG
jgi:uncharacterized protein YgiM (DUF1202 family)